MTDRTQYKLTLTVLPTTADTNVKKPRVYVLHVSDRGLAILTM